MNDYSFGNFLCELRRRRGLSQYQLGMLVGVTDKAVSKWENGCCKPKTHILYKLSEALDVTADELLTCKYISQSKKGVFAMKKELWMSAQEELYNKFGENPPLEVLNRYLNEYAEFKDAESIVFINLIHRLKKKAQENQGLICVRGALGASFTAYLLDASDISPLKPHYFCRKCRKIEFCHEAKCGWDLPDKLCDCGSAFEKDGHDLPYEMLRHAFTYNSMWDISFSSNLYSDVKAEITDYFKDFRVYFMKCGQQNIEKAVIVTDDAISLPKNKPLIFEEQWNKIKNYPQMSLMKSNNLDQLTKLIGMAHMPLNHASLFSQAVLASFISGNTDGVPEFSSEYVKKLIKSTAPKTFNDLIQIMGLAHGSGGYDTVTHNVFSFDRCIAFRDDVFNYVKEKLSEQGLQNTGYAYKVADDARRGIYSKSGIPQRELLRFKELGFEDWFIDSLKQSSFLFPKAHAIALAKNSIVFMRHKLNCNKTIEI